MVERQVKGLSYNCDEKYFPGHKCKEKNIFMAISEDVSKDDVEAPLVSVSPKPIDMTRPSNPPEVEPVISLNYLTDFSTPKTLKLIGYNKHRMVIILVDSGSTHSFIHLRISQETNFYIRFVNNFQIMIANGGSIKCGGRCENVSPNGECHMKSHVFSIDMSGCDIVLGEEWIRTLGLILMNFKELTMQFDQEGQKYKFQGIIVGSPDIIGSHHMENLLKKGHSGIISQLHAIQATKTPSVPEDLQSILSKDQVVFFTPQGIPPSHVVHIILFPFSQEDFLSIYVPIIIPFPKKLKLRKLFNNFSTTVLFSLVRSPTLLLWSWSLRKNVLGTCVLNFVHSKHSPFVIGLIGRCGH
jgi:hypothetical protein